MTRGIKKEVDDYVNTMSGQLLPYPIPGKPGMNVQLAMRPIQLWEVVFPKEQLGRVLGACKWDGKGRKDMQLHLAALRKILKAKKIPEMDLSKIPPLLVYNQNVAIYPIGIKEDKIKRKGMLYEGAEDL